MKQNTPTSSKKMFNIGVFTSASNQLDPFYYNVAAELGSYLAKEGHHIIYGGANIGLMGSLAKSALDQNGRVTGVFPRSLVTREIACPNLTELIYTDGLHERKKIIYEMSDLFITMPGGFGTLDETFEVLTWNQLGHFDKPLYFYNANNFFNELMQFIKKLEIQKFIKVYDNIHAASFNNIAELNQILSNPIGENL